ncbi:hypothetical protein BaRGS_00016856, partial [Batillaria attramentaria]
MAHFQVPVSAVALRAGSQIKGGKQGVPAELRESSRKPLTSVDTEIYSRRRLLPIGSSNRLLSGAASTNVSLQLSTGLNVGSGDLFVPTIQAPYYLNRLSSVTDQSPLDISLRPTAQEGRAIREIPNAVICLKYKSLLRKNRVLVPQSLAESGQVKFFSVKFNIISADYRSSEEETVLCSGDGCAMKMPSKLSRSYTFMIT